MVAIERVKAAEREQREAARLEASRSRFEWRTARECPALRDGIPQFRDKDHLTATAARTFTAAWLADPSRYDRTYGPPASPEHP